ncbi:MAG TPA: SDR family oxidoreductase [Candidatus Angelobacter sp.]|nr:SDR family oxidoreductase [Candidatus Angelobacter sp.]
MKVLFIGGTGNISKVCAELAIARGYDVTLLNRGKNSAVRGARHIVADMENTAAVASALGSQHWDVVADFIIFTPEQLEQRLGLFRGRVGQFIFISSASAYQKPVTHYLITESTPLANPFWDYSRNKIACEDRLLRALRDENFPSVIVRPSWTYGETIIPLAVTSHGKNYFTGVDRMRQGKPMIVPGDGSSLWAMTHNTDFAKGFVGLFGNPATIGHAFHITSDEVLSWNQIYQVVADAAGVRDLRLVHIASDFITACLPEFTGGLHGDKACSVVFDNTKIKRFVPDFAATTKLRDGVAKSIAWYDADPSRQIIDHEANAKWDKLIAAYERGLEAAKREFGQ